MTASSPLKERMVRWVKSLQNEICSSLENFEPESRFVEKEWHRPGGGGGQSRVLSGGRVFEKAGVNVSVVEGELPKSMQEKLGSSTAEFFATGISLVIHPASPHVETVHANFRYFEQADRAWFGGGADLTPYVYAPDDFSHFHAPWKEACAAFPKHSYAKYKQACDQYFYIPHRQEHRGIGGIFFDYLKEDLEGNFDFVQKCGAAFLPSYLPLVEKNFQKEFSEREKEFQLLRRGRYVEFNLVYDRGTKFGLETQGNTESILMSLPPEVKFEYCAQMDQSESEISLMKVLREPVDW